MYYMSIIGGLLALAIFIGICGGIIVLQVFLSKKDSKLPGLILPITSFSISMVVIIGMALFMVVQVESHVTRVTDVEMLTITRLDELREADFEQAIERERAAEMESILIDRLESIEHFEPQRNIPFARITFIFLAFNIPTAILLGIYAACRSKRNQLRALEKMSVQDL